MYQLNDHIPGKGEQDLPEKDTPEKNTPEKDTPEKDKSEKEIPFSYHTFLYPFLWDQNGTRSIQEFKDLLSLDAPTAARNRSWKPDDVLDAQLELTGKDTEERRWNYQRFQYFNSAARKALFRGDGEIVSCYALDCNNDWRYWITNRVYKDEKIQDTHQHLLRVNNIRLKLFNTGVAVIVFEMEYHLCDQKAPKIPITPLQAVKEINEYGRRLYPECIPAKHECEILCAEELKLLDGAGNPIASDLFRDQVEKILDQRDKNRNGDNSDLLEQPTRTPGVVANVLLSNLSPEEIESRRESLRLIIKPAIDDRMFVCCCITEGGQAEYFMDRSSEEREFQGLYESRVTGDGQAYDFWSPLSEKRAFQNSYEIGKELYALINVDADGSSCQDRPSLYRYLDEQLYLRWADWGTFHAVTNHSFFCVTNAKSANASVVVPFLILYVDLCALVLAQRATLISLDAQITEAISKDDSDHWDRLIKLEQAFSKFQGELMLQEVTSQIQGIELYQKLWEMLFVDELERNVQRQLTGLYEIAQAKQAEYQKKQLEERKRKENEQVKKLDRMNFLITAFTLLSLISVVTDVKEILENVCDFFWPIMIVLAIGLAIAILVVVGFHQYWRSEDKPLSENRQRETADLKEKQMQGK